MTIVKKVEKTPAQILTEQEGKPNPFNPNVKFKPKPFEDIPPPESERIKIMDPIERQIRLNSGPFFSKHIAKQREMNAILKQFRQALDEKDPDRAESLCRRLWKLLPGIPEIYLYLGNIALLRGNPREALARMNQHLYHAKRLKREPEDLFRERGKRKIVFLTPFDLAYVSTLIYMDKARIYRGRWHFQRASDAAERAATHAKEAVELGKNELVEKDQERLQTFLQEALVLQAWILSGREFSSVWK